MGVFDADAGRLLSQAWLDDKTREPVGTQRETTSAAFCDDRLLVPSRAAIYAVDPRTLGAELWSHQPLMTDLHSVSRRAAGGVWVTSTGIDAVLALDPDGMVVERRDLAAPIRGDDFRSIPYAELKPHQVHPNAASERDGVLWVTEFERHRAQGSDGRRIELPEGPPHDGHLREGLVWYTTVTGHVIAVDPGSLERIECYDLNALTDSDRALGWCRGVEVVGDRVFVGMTQLRKSLHIEALRWMVRGERGRLLPTRVVELSRSQRRIVRETVIGNRAGGTIHGLLALPD